MVSEEARRASEGLANTERGTISNYLGLIKNYVRWCEKHQVFQHIERGFYDINVPDIDPVPAFQAEFFRNEDDFLESLGSVRNLSEFRSDTMTAVLAWIGVSTDDIVTLSRKSFDLESRRVLREDGSVMASWQSEGIHMVMQTVLSAPEPTIFGEPIKPRVIAAHLQGINRACQRKGLAPRFSYENIYRSGGVFRLWLAEQSGIDVLRAGNRSLMAQIYGGSKVHNRIAWQYELYKRAFNLSTS